MARRWPLIAAMGVAAVAVSAAAVLPGRWSAGRLAAEVARQMASGDAAAVVAESAPGLRPYLSGGHLAAAIAPLSGARVSAVRVLQVRSGEAEASVRYAGGRTATIEMVASGGGRWEVQGLS